ncbi:MAG: hydrogenase expression/formation protein HypE [Spirochaetaceae bacterium]|nr:hydrogenase expression/formation protein HypE [Spirochaetaceae bacterium]
MSGKITMDHGSGYGKTSELIESLFLKLFSGEKLSDQGDSAILNVPFKNIAFTTDSFVIKPIFFPGGDIGKLAVCGTVNDLAVSGAVPKYISCGFILEEGLPMEELQSIIISMANTSKACGVQIVTGDTKVVEKGACDKLFINTSGIGFINEEYIHISTAERVSPGDNIIINGPIAEHGLAVLSFRNSFENSIVSDCTPLNKVIQGCINTGGDIHFMRDATRGGIASVLSELANKTSLGVELFEKAIPISDETAGLCEILGFDPLYVANEGKVIMVVSEEDSPRVLAELRSTKEGLNSKVIGTVTDRHPEKIVLNTSIGGRRIVDIPEGTQLPRIC